MNAAVAQDIRNVRGRAERLLIDFPYYAEHCLTIRSKAGGLVPLRLNRIQRTVHDRLEEQLRETGRKVAHALSVKFTTNSL